MQPQAHQDLVDHQQLEDGLDEPSIAEAASAVLNAVFAATGKLIQ
jgi:CO/xanthine dehydrogenase Mo-binding subunit